MCPCVIVNNVKFLTNAEKKKCAEVKLTMYFTMTQGHNVAKHTGQRREEELGCPMC